MSRALRLSVLMAGLAASSGAPRRSAAQGPAMAAAVPPADVPQRLVLSDQARRFLVLLSRALPTEFMGCMIGTVRGPAVMVERIAPADVDPSHSTATWVVPQQSCEGAGWSGTVGTIHSHPTAEQCWYFFPGTRVASSDGQSFLRTAYAVDAIACANRVVWINRAMVEQEVPLTLRRSPE